MLVYHPVPKKKPGHIRTHPTLDDVPLAGAAASDRSGAARGAGGAGGAGSSDLSRPDILGLSENVGYIPNDS